MTYEGVLRTVPSAVTARTHEKACFSRSGCECCDLRASKSCLRLPRELSRTGAATQALMVSFEPECITQCAGEHQTLQPWPVQSHREGRTD